MRSGVENGREVVEVVGDGTILIEAHATNSMRLILER